MRKVALAPLLASLLASVTFVATDVDARPPPPGHMEEIARARTLSFDIGPAIGEPGGYPAGAVELVVRVQNSGDAPQKGRIVITPDDMWGQTVVTAGASFAVAGQGETFVRIPFRASGGIDVAITTEGTEPPFSTRLYARTTSDVAIALLTPTSPVRASLLGAAVLPAFDPPDARSGSTSPTLPIAVHVPRVDPVTGDPLLPERTIGWAHEHLVLARTDLVGRLGAESMEALAGFVLGGGTLALVVARPEDLRSARVASLLGGEASPIPAPAEARSPSGQPSDPSRGIDPSVGAPPAEGTRLSGWAGGNLRPSPFGASATYGLGEVVLLSFDADDPSVIDDPFARRRLLDLAARAFDRRASVALDPTIDLAYGGAVEEEIRRQLDPNENTRWTVGVAAVLLLAYAIMAGPVSFSRATSRGKPLRALWHLPIWSLGTFLLIVALGAFAKGLTGRARHMTLVDAGAGMDVGVARRWRGFYASRATDVEVRATDRSSFPWMASVDGAELFAGARLEAERDGARLLDVPALPWECVVIREEGLADLGEGIGVADDPAGGVVVSNGTGRALRGVLVKQPDDQFRYIPRIEAGSTARSLDGDDLAGRGAAMSGFLRTVSAGRTVGRMTVHPFGAWQLESAKLFDEESRDLGAAWKAIEQATSRGATDWFPSGVPVVLAQVDGGEGRTSDSGFAIDQDRLLVRVVGWGR